MEPFFSGSIKLKGKLKLFWSVSFTRIVSKVSLVGVLTIMLWFLAALNNCCQTFDILLQGEFPTLCYCGSLRVFPPELQPPTHRDGFSFLSAASQWAAEWVFTRPSSMRSHGHCIKLFIWSQDCVVIYNVNIENSINTKRTNVYGNNDLTARKKNPERWRIL